MNKNFVVSIGNWFFKYRSYFFVPIIIALIIFTKPAMPFDSRLLDIITDFFGFFIALLGFALRVLVIGYKKPMTSGRGTNIDVNEVVTDGAYQMCRNPLYFANFLIWLGFTIIWWNFIFFLSIVMFFWIEYYFIIKAEESYLSNKFGSVYDNFRKTVPVFFPKLTNFKKPDRQFNWNKVFKAESKLLLLILTFPLLFEIYEDKIWDSQSLHKNIILIFIVLVILIIHTIFNFKMHSKKI